MVLILIINIMSNDDSRSVRLSVLVSALPGACGLLSVCTEPVLGALSERVWVLSVA